MYTFFIAVVLHGRLPFSHILIYNPISCAPVIALYLGQFSVQFFALSLSLPLGVLHYLYKLLLLDGYSVIRQCVSTICCCCCYCCFWLLFLLILSLIVSRFCVLITQIKRVQTARRFQSERWAEHRGVAHPKGGLGGQVGLARRGRGKALLRS